MRSVRYLNIAAIFMAGFVTAAALFIAVGLVGADDARQSPRPSVPVTTTTTSSVTIVA